MTRDIRGMICSIVRSPRLARAAHTAWADAEAQKVETRLRLTHGLGIIIHSNMTMERLSRVARRVAVGTANQG